MSAFSFCPGAFLHPKLNRPRDKLEPEMAPRAHTSVQAAVASRLWLRNEEKGKGSALKCRIFEVPFHVRSEPGTSWALADFVAATPVVLPQSPHQDSPSPSSSETPTKAEIAKAVLNFWMQPAPGLTQLCNYFIQLGPQGKLN